MEGKAYFPNKMQIIVRIIEQNRKIFYGCSKKPWKLLIKMTKKMGKRANIKNGYFPISIKWKLTNWKLRKMLKLVKRQSTDKKTQIFSQHLYSTWEFPGRYGSEKLESGKQEASKFTSGKADLEVFILVKSFPGSPPESRQPAVTSSRPCVFPIPPSKRNFQ